MSTPTVFHVTAHGSPALQTWPSFAATVTSQNDADGATDGTGDGAGDGTVDGSGDGACDGTGDG